METDGRHRLALLLLLAMFALAMFAGGSVQPASAHRSGCHTKHSCPSDHATYRWQGKRCVSPKADERTAAFKIKVRYGGLTYFCRR